VRPGPSLANTLWFPKSDVNQRVLKQTVRRYGSVRFQISATVVDALGWNTIANRVVTISPPKH
jgi:hypothetical protein